MKSLEDMLGASAVPNVPVAQSDEIPTRLYTDSQLVGYIDQDAQYSMYSSVLLGNMPFTGKVSIVDVGCGRGDIVNYIKKLYPDIELEYTGYELNPVLHKIGSDLLSNTDNATIVLGDFITADVKSADIVLMIGSLNLNYNRDITDWAYFEQMLRKSIRIANERVIFVLLHSNGGIEQYIAYPIPNVTELLLQLNIPFRIEYDGTDGVYLLTIDTSNKQQQL